MAVNGHPCVRRVQKLSLSLNAREFASRHCYDLTYQSRRRDMESRAIVKAYIIRERLGGNACLEEEFALRLRNTYPSAIESY